MGVESGRFQASDSFGSVEPQRLRRRRGKAPQIFRKHSYPKEAVYAGPVVSDDRSCFVKVQGIRRREQTFKWLAPL
jgi:hypothetical protein